ncbi:MAG TPA: hypothetical protein VFH72_05275 [Candidatus Baltobacteraceae bacterium]|nr:hypothetical protein [Candidatus Baltobacteraceae bacterium]
MSSIKRAEAAPFTNPMNLTCKPAVRSGRGRYEYCIVLNTHGAAASAPAGEGWMPLPGFEPDPNATYRASGPVGKPDAHNNQTDADTELSGAQIAVFYRVAGGSSSHPRATRETEDRE